MICGSGFVLAGTAMLTALAAGSAREKMLLLIVPIFLVAGLLVPSRNLIPTGFDIGHRTFYRCCWRRGDVCGDLRNPRGTSFEWLHAVQPLTRTGRIGGGTDTASRDRYYHCFKLILVLADETRRHVMTYGEPFRALIDAGSIAALAEIPVWDALEF